MVILGCICHVCTYFQSPKRLRLHLYPRYIYFGDGVTKKKRDPDNNQTPPRSTALLVTGLAFLTHTPAKHSQQLAQTQTPLSLLQAQSLHRASKMEFHNSDSHKNVSANTSIQPPRTSNRGLRSICPLPHSPPKTDHSKLLISCTSPGTTLFYHLILAGSDSFQTQELAFS
jgi:hypothetical protein